MLTAAESVPTSSELPAPTPLEAPFIAHSSRAAIVIPVGTLAFLACCAIVLFLDWRVGIPLVLATSIAGVLLVNRAVTQGLAVDDRADAAERMLQEHERSYPQTLTGVDTELVLAAAWTRRTLQSSAERTAHGLLTYSRRLHVPDSLQVAPLARSLQAAMRHAGGSGYGDRRSH